MAAYTIEISFCSLTVRITTNYVPFYEYLLLHFSKIVRRESFSQSADVCISVNWHDDTIAVSRLAGQKRIAANTVIGDGLIETVRKIQRKKKVKLNFKCNQQAITLDAVVRRKKIKDYIRYELFKKPQESFFFELAYAVVYYPLFWHLETFSQIHPMHASAVKVGQQSVIICGLEGTGKTTLALGIAQACHGTLLSDNLIFYDQHVIYPCYEPIRLHKNENEQLWQGQLQPIQTLRSMKDFYEPLAASSTKSSPAIVIFPVFGDTFTIKQFSPDFCAGYILTLNHLAQELGNYTEYANLLNLFNGQHQLSAIRYKNLCTILQNCHCIEVTMARKDGLVANTHRVVQILKERL